MKWRDAHREDRRRAAGFLALSIIALVYLGVLSTPGEGGFLACPFRAITGYSCPGCGMTRASSSLLHGHLWASLKYHPLALPVAVGIGALVGNAAATLGFGKVLVLEPGSRARRLADLGWWALLIALVVHGVGRLVLELAGILTPV